MTAEAAGGRARDLFPLGVSQKKKKSVWSGAPFTLLTVAPLLVVGGDAPLDLEVGGRLAVELAVGSGLSQREVAAGRRLTGLQLGVRERVRERHCHSAIVRESERQCRFVIVS